MKLTKCRCTTSGKIVKELKCRVKPISRYVGALSLEGTISKPMSGFFVTFFMDFKHFLALKFRQVFKFRDLKVCDITEMATSNSVLSPLIKWFNLTFKGLIRKCPYYGKVNLTNITMDPGNEANQKFFTFQGYPNGDYRTTIDIFGPQDENILHLVFFVELKSREKTLNADENF